MRIAGVPLIFIMLSLTIRSAIACEISEMDRRWLEGTLELWTLVNENDLERRPSQPELIVFDQGCAWHLGALDLPAGEIRATEHRGSVRLPNGVSYRHPLLAARSFDGTLPSFSAETIPYRRGGRDRAVAVLALPSLWWRRLTMRAATRHVRMQSVQTRMLRIAIHELVHTTDLPLVMAELRELKNQLGIDGPFNDDFIEHRFRRDARFAQRIEQEISLLERAASATTMSEQVPLAQRAIGIMRERRALFFTGRNGAAAKAEAIFLRLEGVAEWAALRAVARSGASAGMEIERASWSQRHGLALVTLLDRTGRSWKDPLAGVDLTTMLATE